MNPLLTFLTLALLVLNLYASALVLRNILYDTPQKIAQLLIVWLIPVLGGLLVIRIAREGQPRRERSYGEGGGDIGGDLGGLDLGSSDGAAHHDAGFGGGGFGGGGFGDGGGGDGGGGGGD